MFTALLQIRRGCCEKPGSPTRGTSTSPHAQAELLSRTNTGWHKGLVGAQREEELGVRADHKLSMSQPCQAVTTIKQRFGTCKQENNCKTHEGARLLDDTCKGGHRHAVLPACRGARGAWEQLLQRGTCGAQLNHGQCQRCLPGEDAASPGPEGFNFSPRDLRPRERNICQE